MKKGRNRSATGRKPPGKESGPTRLRVLVASSLPLTAAGLEGMLRVHADLEVIVSSANATQLASAVRNLDPDVLVLDIDEYESDNGKSIALLNQFAETVVTIALAADPSTSWIRQALQAGVRGLLPYGVSGEELAAAARAVASGLVALSPEFSERISPPPLHPDADELQVPAESLTAREHEVLAMLAEGLLNKEIADRLRISEHTVKFHISSIMGKLGAASRTEAVMRGIRRGLIFL